MELQCVRIKRVPDTIAKKDVESEWSELKISEHGIIFLSNKMYVFFNDKFDAAEAENRGFYHKDAAYKVKQISIDDCINEMRPLVKAEKVLSLKNGEKYEYPIIFETNKIRIKWEDQKAPIVQPQEQPAEESDYTDEDDSPPIPNDENDEPAPKKSKKEKKAKKEKKKKEKKSKKKKKKNKEHTRSVSRKSRARDHSNDKYYRNDSDHYSREHSRDRHDYSSSRRSNSRDRKDRTLEKPKYSRDRSRDEYSKGRQADSRGKYDSSDGDFQKCRSTDRKEYSRRHGNADECSYRDQDSSRERKRRHTSESKSGYNPLALLGGQLKKDGEESRNKKSRWEESSLDSPKSAGIDLRAKLSRTNKRAEEKAKRIERAKEQMSVYNRGRGGRGRSDNMGRGRGRGRGRNVNHYNDYGNNNQMNYPAHQGMNQMNMNMGQMSMNPMALMMQMQQMMQNVMQNQTKIAEEQSQIENLTAETAIDGSTDETLSQPLDPTVKDINLDQPSDDKSDKLDNGESHPEEEQNGEVEKSNDYNIGLSLDELIAKTKEKVDTKTVEGADPLQTMQKMMAMMTGQIPMDPSVMNFDPSMVGNLDPTMTANMNSMLQNFMSQGSMVHGGGFDNCWGVYDPSMMTKPMGPSMEEQIAAAKPMLKNIDQTDKKFIDTHCHIDTMYKKEGYNGDWDMYRENVAIEFPNSYEGCITSFCDPKLFQKKFAFNVLEHDKVWACFGCHPHHAHLYNADVEAQLEILAKHPKTVAWGAIGLDYSDKFGRTDHELQKSVFRRQCELAVKNKLPIVIQCRKAERDLMTIMKEIVPKEHKIHRHCLNDKMTTVKEAFEYYPNMFFGFTNVITNQNASGPRSAVAECPLERILIETDAPHFVPRTLRSDVFGGTTPVSMSHPGMALCVALEIAQFQMRSLDEVIEVTRENAKALYGI